MKAAGIIAEYNPLHNGHSYQLAKVKEETGADYIVVAMSGDFVQRGAPAIADKYVRAQMALYAGADIVLEIPALWAASSAEYFARAGVELLGSTGVVDTVCYGCESVQPQLVHMLAQKLLCPGEAYEAELAKLLRGGMHYPLARQEALCKVLPDEYGDAVRKFLSSPNNILALEYEKAIAQWNLTNKTALVGHAILRIGSGYHDTAMQSRFPSATALRQQLYALLTDAAAGSDAWESLRECAPETTLALLRHTAEHNQLMDPDDFSGALYAALLAQRNKGYASFADCPASLSNRIGNCLNDFLSFTQFAGLLKTKELTFTRVSRVLTHIMLGFTQEDCSCDPIPYIRVLGFVKSASPVLASISEKAPAPLITRVADASHVLSGSAMHTLQKDIYAADLYRGVCSIKSRQTLPNEYTQPLIVYQT